MNWVALQAIAEIVSAVGVIISLLYLAVQVRQNTKSIRSAASQELLSNYHAVLESATQNEFGARIYHASFNGNWDELTIVEQGAARNGIIRMMRVYEQAFLQYRDRNLDDAIWEGWATQIKLSIGVPGVFQVWSVIRPIMNGEFASWVDEHRTEGEHIAVDYLKRWHEISLNKNILSDD